MLFYLDNWLSVGPDSDFARGISRRNDNYRLAATSGECGVPPRRSKPGASAAV